MYHPIETFGMTLMLFSCFLLQIFFFLPKEMLMHEAFFILSFYLTLVLSPLKVITRTLSFRGLCK